MEKRICKDCGVAFRIPPNEERFYESKNMSLPVRCKECRAKRKQDRGGKSKGSGYKGRSEQENRDLLALHTTIIVCCIVMYGLSVLLGF